MIPENSVPMDKSSQTKLVPPDKWSLKYSVCPRGQAEGIWKYGDQIGWGPFVQGDQMRRSLIKDFFQLFVPAQKLWIYRRTRHQMYLNDGATKTNKSTRRKIDTHCLRTFVKFSTSPCQTKNKTLLESN